MEQIKTTPAQEAREYAAEKGFVIATVGRRYKATHTETGTEFERGSYTALLNEMRAVHNCDTAAKKVHCDVVREDGAMGVDADAIVGNVGAADSQCVESGVDAAVTGNWPVKSFDEITADIKVGVQQIREMSSPEVMAERQRHIDALWDMEVRKLEPDVLLKLVQMATGATLDKIARAKGWPARTSGPLQTDQKYRNVLLYGFADGPDATITTLDVLSRISVPLKPDEHDDRIPVFSYSIPIATGKGLDELAKILAFDDFNEESKKRIRAAADRMRPKKAGKFLALVQYAEPDRDGNDTYTFNCDTRPDAVKWIRQQLSGKQGKHIIRQTISVGV